jgi:WD40 repeat protein
VRESQPRRIFVSYAERDAEFFAALEKHLTVLRRRGQVDIWHSGRVAPGASLDENVRVQIDLADIIVLLVSSDYLASERHWREHMEHVLSPNAVRSLPLASGSRHVIPVKIRSVLSLGAPFDHLQTLPRDGTPITDAGNDEAWTAVAEQISSLLTIGDIRSHEHEPHELLDRPTEFKERVGRLCALREKLPLVPCRATPPFSALWEVETSSDPIDVKPIAALDGTPTLEVVNLFDSLLDKRYRGEHPYLQSALIYRGPAAQGNVVRFARSRGVALTSFESLNRLVDFDSYLERLRERLTNDPVYPQDLYVDQRGLLVVGRDGSPVDSALESLWSLVTDPRQPLFMFVLADFGTGKTFLLRQLAARLAEPGSAVVPILIELRALEKARSLDALLMQHFALVGERSVNLDHFYHALEQGKVALLFDGFDELVPRVSFERAAEHLETLTEAARGMAKVIITSRTQHFLSDTEVEQAFARRADRVPHRQLFKLLPFTTAQIWDFLVQHLGSTHAANRRYTLLGHVTDLLGLSQNPRMLSFIVEIDEDKLLAAQDRAGTITKAELYTLLIERWIDYEFKRSEYRGVPTLLDGPGRWRAVLVLAERLWGSGDKGIELRHLPLDLQEELKKLGPPELDASTKAQHAASRTLLVRDEEGTFSFLHRSILEFAAAWAAASALRAGKADARLITATEMSELMAEFFTALATHEHVIPWVRRALEGQGTPIEKRNAQRVLEHLPRDIRAKLGQMRIMRRGEDLRGQSFVGQDLSGVNFADANLSEAVLARADLTGANLSRAKLVRTDLKGAIIRNADLRGADLSFAGLVGADLRGARLDGAQLPYAKLLGVQADPGVLKHLSNFGSTPTYPVFAQPVTLPSLFGPNAVTLSPDGTLLASGHFDGALILWHAGRDAVRVWRVRGGRIRSVAFSPNGRFLASNSADNKIRIWNVEDGSFLCELRHPGTPTCVAFSPGGQLLAVGSHNDSVCIWSIKDRAMLNELSRHTLSISCVAFSPDGALIASASYDKSVRIWEVGTGEQITTLAGHLNGVMCIAFSPDGTSLASGSNDAHVALWNVQGGHLMRRFQGHTKAVLCLAFSPDARFLASASEDGSVRLWNLADSAAALTLQGHSGAVSSVAFSSDGRTLSAAYGDTTVQQWNVQDATCVGTTEVRSTRGRSNSVMSVSFSPDGASVATGSSAGPVRLWSLVGGSPRHALVGHTGPVGSVVFSRDGSMLASGSYDNTIRLWRMPDCASLLTLEGHTNYVLSVAISADASMIASGSSDNSVCLWRSSDGALLRRLQGHTNSVWSVAFSPDGSLLASCASDKSLRLWRLPGGDEALTLNTHPGPEWAATDGAGKTMAAESVRHMRLPDESPQQDGDMRANPMWSVAFSPNGRLLASGSSDNSVLLWGLPGGDPLQALEGHSNSVWSVAFSPDGRLLASASSDNTVCLWSLPRGVLFKVLEGHSNSVLCVAFSPDGRLLVSGSYDKSVRIWNVADGRCAAVLYANETGWVAFTPDGRYKLSGSLQGSFWHVIGLCRFEPGELDDQLPYLRMQDDESLL